MRSMAGAVTIVLVLQVVVGCKSTKSSSTTSSTSSNTATTQPSSTLPTTSAPTTIVSAPPKASAAIQPSFASLFEGPPTEGTRRSETVFGAGGVYAGLPPGWQTEDTYNAYLLAYTKEARAYVYLSSASRNDDKDLEKFGDSAAYPCHLEKLVWDGSWTDAKVGTSPYAARFRRGHGKLILTHGKVSRTAIAIGIKIPNRTPIHIFGSWNEPSPAIEQQFIDIVRGLGRCKHKPNRGCVAVEPVGEEKELAHPRKQAPGSNPFGGLSYQIVSNQECPSEQVLTKEVYNPKKCTTQGSTFLLLAKKHDSYWIVRPT
jgi:hypothetical protein